LALFLSTDVLAFQANIFMLELLMVTIRNLNLLNTFPNFLTFLHSDMIIFRNGGNGFPFLEIFFNSSGIYLLIIFVSFSSLCRLWRPPSIGPNTFGNGT